MSVSSSAHCDDVCSNQFPRVLRTWLGDGREEGRVPELWRQGPFTHACGQFAVGDAVPSVGPSVGRAAVPYRLEPRYPDRHASSSERNGTHSPYAEARFRGNARPRPEPSADANASCSDCRWWWRTPSLKTKRENNAHRVYTNTLC